MYINMYTIYINIIKIYIRNLIHNKIRNKLSNLRMIIKQNSDCVKIIILI